MTVHCRRLIGEGRERKVSVEIHLECSRHIAAIGRNGNHKLSGCGIPVDWPLRIPINRIHCGNLTGTPSPTIKMQTHVATLTVTTPHRGQRTIAGIQAKRKHLIVPARQSHRPERLRIQHQHHILRAVLPVWVPEPHERAATRLGTGRRERLQEACTAGDR